MSGYLLDTNVIIRWILPNATLRRTINQTVLNVLKSTETRKYVSSISLAEIATKSSIGKLLADLPALEIYLAQSPIIELPFNHRYATALATLSWHHRDPFDRMLIAQAMTEKLTIITSDVAFQQYDLPVLMLE